MQKRRSIKFAADPERNEGKRIQFFPLGDVVTVDGEEWTFTREALQAVADRLNAAGQEIPVYVNHMDQADPVGWVSSFAVDDAGLFGLVRWIDEETASRIKAEKLKYTSPGFFVDAGGDLQAVYEISLTNTPRMQGMKAVEASLEAPPAEPTAPRSSSPRMATTRKETRMDLNRIRVLLGLAEDATEEDALLALEARLTQAAPPDQAAQVTAAVQAAVNEIKAATTNLVRAEFEARTAAEAHERKAVAAVDSAIRAGKITVAQRAEAETFARTNGDAFTRFVAAAPRVAPISPRIEEAFGDSFAAVQSYADTVRMQRNAALGVKEA